MASVEEIADKELSGVARQLPPMVVALMAGSFVVATSLADHFWPEAARLLDPWPFGVGWAAYAAAALFALGVVVVLVYQPDSPPRVVRALIGERVFRFLWLLTLSVLSTQTVVTLGRFFVRTFDARHAGSSGRTLVFLAMAALLIVGSFFRPVLRDLVKGYRFSRDILRVLRRLPHDDSGFRLPTFTTAPCDVLLFSDLHIAHRVDGGDSAITLEGGLPDTGLVDFVRRTLAQASPRAVILSGDVTDSGHQSAWDKARSLFDRSRLGLYVAPGNHDVFFRMVTRPAQRLAVTRALLALGDLDDTPAQTTAYTEAEVARAVDGLASEGGVRQPGLLFPVRHDHAALRLSVLVLSSNTRTSNSPISNAIGRVGPAQLAAAEALLSSRPPGHAAILVMHHHIVPPRQRLDRIALVCLDADAVLDLAVRHRAEAIVHGHTHMPYAYRYQGDGHALWILSCGSTLYRAKGRYAREVGSPSCLGLRLDGGRVREVVMYRDTWEDRLGAPLPARAEEAPGQVA